MPPMRPLNALSFRKENQKRINLSSTNKYLNGYARGLVRYALTADVNLYYNGGSGFGGGLSNTDLEILAYKGVYAYQYDIFGEEKTVMEKKKSKNPEKLQ